MTLISLIRLIVRNIAWLLMIAGIAAGMVFKSTKNSPKEYESYTIINTGLVTGYNIESGEGKRIDYGFTNNEMENILSLIKSRETQEELAAQLLAQALMEKAPSIEVVGEPAFVDLKKAIPEKIRKIVVTDSFELTLKNVRAWRDSIGTNPIKEVLSGGNPYFGIDHIEKLAIRREGTTDMIRIAYTTTDPAVCRNTLRMLTKIFIEKNKNVKEGQSADVLSFFENATSQSESSLNSKEDNLLSFMVSNKIINYYEQTRFIAAKKEELDEMYFKEMMVLAAADSARRHLEEQLANYTEIPKINQTLIKQKVALTNISSQIANLELSALDDTLNEQVDDKELKLLKSQSDKLKRNLRREAEALFAIQRTPEGIDAKNILSQWLTQWISVEQGLARLNVFRGRKAEFDQIYNKFAPWGSHIKRLEREIEISEKAYLENLHSYNQARLHKYNMLMMANLRVVDAPFYPEKASPSKRVMLVAMGFLAGFILPLAFLIILALLDQSLQTPERAAVVTDLELFAAFPELPKRRKNRQKLDYDTTMRRASDQLLQRIKLTYRQIQAQNQHKKATPIRISILSTRGKEGKTYLMEYVASQLRGFGEKVLVLKPQGPVRVNKYYQLLPHPDNITYNMGVTFFDVKTEQDLLDGLNIDVDSYDYIFTEIPSLLKNTYPADYINNTDMALLICHADIVWNKADNRVLAPINKLMKRSCSLVLNGVRVDNLETLMGEIPKRRSRFRIWFKKLLSLNLSKA